MRLKNGIAAALAAGMMLGGIAAVPVAAGAESTLTYSWPRNSGVLNPHLYSPHEMVSQAFVYEPLVKYRADGSIVPWLASAWEISPDGRVYTFTLREDVRFSDGTPFDAAAVKANFDAVLANFDRHRWLELISQIEATEVVDEYTFRLTLKGAYYPTLYDLALVRPLRFLSPAAIPANGNTADGIEVAVGTGPWKQVETRLGEYDLYARNEMYWGTQPSFDRLLVKVIPDANSRAIAFETGAIDLIYGGENQVSANTFARLQANKSIWTGISAPQATRVLAVNSGRAPTDDLAVRRAINHAVNKQAIIDAILYGLEPVAHTLFAPNVPYADQGLEPYAYDPAKAAALLDEAGWVQPPGGGIRTRNGQPLRLELCFVGNEAQEKAIAEVIQADLRAVGIDAVLVGEEKSAFLSRQRDGRFGMIFNNTWGAPYEPHSFVASMRQPSHADYQAQKGLPMKAELDAWISDVLVSVDEEARRDLYRDILTTLHEQAVYLPLSYLTSVAAARPNIENVTFGATKNEIPLETVRPATAR
ncbi:nickel ABC transporter substrate-binding protein [Telmatospirillum sp. J64-1]|uniref:nickel ABC transporter substrate-binding protein n=1 Tax=Telmatospirillum sp. J64-1 TaxID=2502183 RepID=UPI00115C94E7|nr:nickel ABC transporter substrate-binding protein [Telmatospirillum sp. J64-1]